jgi:hypothetical protein
MIGKNKKEVIHIYEITNDNNNSLINFYANEVLKNIRVRG